MFLREWKEIRSYFSAGEGRMSREPGGGEQFLSTASRQELSRRIKQSNRMKSC